MGSNPIGAIDDFVFGEGDEWYVIVNWVNIHTLSELDYKGPFKTYEEANKHDKR